MNRIIFLFTLFLSIGSLASLQLQHNSKPVKPQVRLLKIKRGQTVYSLLKAHRFSQKQIQQILAHYPLPPSYTLSPNDLYLVQKTASLYEILFFDKHKNWVYVFWKKGRQSAGTDIRKIPLETRVIQASGFIKGSLITSIQKKIPNQQVAYRFLDAYLYIPNLSKKLKKGAFFSLEVEKKYFKGHFIRYGEVLNTALEINGKIEKRTFIPFPKGGAFVNTESTDWLYERPLYSPVSYIRISSPFEYHRFHPIKHIRKAHLGVDFELPKGAKIFAPLKGKVLRTGRTRGAGRFVVIQHPNGLQSFFNHMSYIAKHIKKGYFVKTGELIGLVGCTGYCTKPHLHFAVKKNGRFVNPVKYIKPYPFQKRQWVLDALARTASDLPKSVHR
ncbi:MAG: M23 family metallopeptidase [Bdellovibrio sp.]|nr:MAG: M23 family metallopeptidase [Bdellovibrio sp.]